MDTISNQTWKDTKRGRKQDPVAARFAAVKERSHAHRVALAARHEAVLVAEAA
jgi:hypothetical protein